MERKEICLENDSIESNMKPRILADRRALWVELKEERIGVDFCRGLLKETMKRNSVLEGLKIR